MKGLTQRQEEILRFIRDHSVQEGYWPSIRNIQDHFGFRSTNSVVGHLRALEKKGYLERPRHQARAYRLREPLPFADESTPAHAGHQAVEVVEIPILGNIAAGYPDQVEPAGQVESLQVDAFTARQRRQHRTFAIRVRGESMIGAGIQDGDTVVVEAREPKDGDVVAALIDGQTTLKRFLQPAGHTPYLKAENPDYPELYPVEELVIQGVATSFVRKL